MNTYDKPSVTIVTVTFNIIDDGRKAYFRQCVESVHNQTHENVEHIIIDGASTDGTVKLIKEYAKRGWVKYISEPDSGIYEAMNKGIKLAKGKYIAFLNSDDYYCTTEAIEMSVVVLEKDDVDFSYADYFQFNDRKKVLVEGIIEKFLYIMPFGHPTMFTKTSVMRKENGFNEKYGLPSDYDLIIRLIMKDYKSVYIETPISVYRTNGRGCVTDTSDDVAHICYDNYRVFQKEITLTEAKGIHSYSVTPSGFTKNFIRYAKMRSFNNINTEKVSNFLSQNLIEKNKISNILIISNLAIYPARIKSFLKDIIRKIKIKG